MWFDVLLVILAFAMMLAGLAGAVLPLPGPPLSFLGLLLLHWTRWADFSATLLWGLGLASAIVMALDYIVPAWGVKRYGGGKAGVWGSTVGLLVGMFFGPLGIFVGAFGGALLGELLVGKGASQAMSAAFGSFVGFVFGVALKLALCGAILWYGVAALV